MATIILGLDGMSLELLELCQKDMPNLHGLLSKSAYTSAKSVFPILSGPAWTSILTGQGVGKHGFLNSFYYDDKMQVRITQPEDVSEEHLYETLSRFGKRVFVMDVPFSTSRKIKGDFLDSYFSTKEKRDQIVPADLVTRFPSIRNYLNYKPKIKNMNKNIRSFIEIINNNGEIIKDIINSKSYDLMFFQLSIVDWIQHKALIEIKHRPRSRKARVSVLVLRELDHLIGWIISHLCPEDHFFVISDHGGTELEGTFFINSWLRKEGFLRLMEPVKRKNNLDGSSSSRLSNFLGETIGFLAKTAKSNRLLLNMAKPIHRKMRSYFGKDFSSEEKINYQESKAVCLIKNIPIIKILEKDFVKREQLKRDIMARLRDDLAFTSWDILDYYHCCDASSEIKGRLRHFGDIVVDLEKQELDVFLGNRIFLKGKTMFHDENSIFIGYGPEIKVGKIKQEISIMDICPTVLYFFGIPIPNSKDGKVMDIFRKEFIPPSLESPKPDDENIEMIDW